jgi:hypothetical protein
MAWPYIAARRQRSTVPSAMKHERDALVNDIEDKEE